MKRRKKTYLSSDEPPVNQSSSDNMSEEERFMLMLSKNQSTILQICSFFSNPHSDSINDLYQDIACALWESWPSLRHEAATNSWVRRVATNVAISAFRNNRKRQKFVPLEDWMCDAVSEETSNAPPDYKKILENLKPKFRAILYLHLEGYTIKDISETLGITKAAVKQRLYRIRLIINKTKKTIYE